jgi:hypothetical protein
VNQMIRIRIHRSSRITQHWYVFGLQFSLW